MLRARRPHAHRPCPPYLRNFGNDPADYNSGCTFIGYTGMFATLHLCINLSRRGITDQIAMTSAHKISFQSCSSNRKQDEASIAELESFLSQYSLSDIFSQTVNTPVLDFEAGLGHLPPPSRYVREDKIHSKKSFPNLQQTNALQQSISHVARFK